MQYTRYETADKIHLYPVDGLGTKIRIAKSIGNCVYVCGVMVCGGDEQVSLCVSVCIHKLNIRDYYTESIEQKKKSLNK